VPYEAWRAAYAPENLLEEAVTEFQLKDSRPKIGSFKLSASDT